MGAFKNLIGQRFGKLTVLNISDKRDSRIYWECRCDCGTIKNIAGGHLSGGRINSCGCIRLEKTNFIGQKFGRLTVLEYSHTDNNRNSHWKCKCDCGNIVIVDSHSFKRGHTKSCGCLKKETDGKSATTHGKCKTKEYKIWQAIIQRCTNFNNEEYHNYGGRGIIICKEWLNFKNFYKDMGEKPQGMSIDRKNNDKGYSKENCRWATYKEQGNNTRRNKLIEYNGKIQTMAQWADELNIKYITLKRRIHDGWSINRALGGV